MIEWLMSRRKKLPCWATRPVRTLDYFVNAFVFPDVSASCVCSKDKFILRIFNFRQYQGWLETRLVKEKLQERREKSWRCSKLEKIDRNSQRGKNMDQIALEDVKIVKIQIMMMMMMMIMTSRLWKSKWWLLRGGKVYELDARWKFWLVDNFERRESKFSRNMAW